MFGRAQRRSQQHIAPDLLSTYLDGQVTPRDRGRVEQHLRVCTTCKNELRTLRYTKDLLRTTPRVRVPRAFVLSEADIGRTISRRPGRLAIYMQAATALVAALLIVVVVGDFLQLPVMRPTPPAAVPMMAEKAVVETVTVEREVPQAAAREPLPEAPAAEEAAPAVEEPAELEMQALSVSPEEETQMAGGGQQETARAASAPQPTMAKAVQTEQPELHADEPEPEATAVAPPVATDSSQPILPARAVAPQPTSWWTWTRAVEVLLAALFVILLSLSLRLRGRL